MDRSFWQQKWESNDIPFHESNGNPLLTTYFEQLSLAPNSRVFVPMCGKSLDLHWLLKQGYRVAGAELSQIAVTQLFAELGCEPTITPMGPTTRYSATGIDIFHGDFFLLQSEVLGPVDGIYDRAALVALPEPMRNEYTAHLMEITSTAPQLLITFHYDQQLENGPPFSVDQDEVTRHYQESYRPKLAATVEIPGGLRGRCPATEEVWLLEPKPTSD